MNRYYRLGFGPAGDDFLYRGMSHTLYLQSLSYALLKMYWESGLLSGISQEDILLLSKLSLYHDIGKRALPDSILHKAGKLTPEEWRLMKEHTTLGAKMVEIALPELRGSKEYVYIREICLHHHERWDGGGYPDGLRGDEMLRYVQVIAIAEVYDALRAPRPYRPPFCHEEAAEMMLSGQCGAFFPVLLWQFRDQIDAIQKSIYPSAAGRHD